MQINNNILMDWQQAKTYVYPVMLPMKQKLEKQVIQKSWLDLTVYYVVRLVQEEPWNVQIRITQGMLQQWGIREEELLKQAMLNMKQGGYKVEKILNVLLNALPDIEVPEDVADEGCAMIVLTNKAMNQGAVAILDKEILKEIAGEQSMYILPASIHEVILLPEREGVEKEKMDAMVQQVNVESVLPEERLSNHAYYYNGKKGIIEM